MNDAELDALARRAATSTRAEARAIADSEAALQRLLAGQATESAPPLAPVVPYHGPIRDADRRRRWVIVAAAAVFTLLVGGIAWAAFTGDTTIEIADGPVGGTGSGTGPSLGTSAPSAPVPGSSVPPSSVPGTGTGPATSVITVPTTEITVPATPSGSKAITVPEFVRADSRDLPFLLLRPATPSSLTYASDTVSSDTDPTLTQVWVRTTDGRAVDAAVVVQTRETSAPDGGAFPGAGPIDVPGWEAVQTSLPGEARFTAQLVTGDLVVGVVVLGLDEAAGLALLRDITPSGERYAVPSLEAPWVELPSAWTTGVARREMVVLDEGEGDVAWSIDVAAGDDLLVNGVDLADPGLELAEVGGQPALLQRSPIPRVVVMRDDGLMIRVGSRDPASDVVAAAEALIEVDAATWAESTTPRPEDWDGCISLFC